ncbi:MAG TPA: IclR family transcriptional regulator C-terminal domain-containing protein [Yinghuangia sp.]|nr:IclR family transcriptional regulator C-terminal domain-containing protein [Yinghuangia sp.]
MADKDGAARHEREMAGGSSTADFSEALARGLAVLAAFDSEHRHRTQADLARQLGLSRATVRRAVLTLEHLGYLQAEGRTYRLTPQILDLAGGYLTSNPVSTVLQPVCDRICAQLDEACSAAVLDGKDAVIVARAVPNRLIAVGAGIGYRTPIAISSLGKVLLAHLDADERAAVRATLDGAPDTLDDHTLDSIRVDGFSYVANDVEMGSHSIAVPLRRWDDRVIAAIHVGCNIESISPADMHDEVLQLLTAAADEVRPRLV